MDGLSFLEFATQYLVPSGALLNPLLDFQLKLTHLCFFFPAVFWGDIALDEEDLKLFHIDKPSVEEMGHRTGKYCIYYFPCPGGRGPGRQQGQM